MAELVFLIYCGCGALAVALSAFVHQKRLRRIVTGIRELQLLLLQPTVYRRATPEDQALVERIPSDKTDELSRRLVLVGDVILSLAGKQGALRLFIDADRTTLVYVYAGTSVSIGAESYTEVEELKTTSEPQGYWTRPPFFRFQSVKYRDAENFLKAHDDFLQTAIGSLVGLGTLDEIIELWKKSREREMAWRAAQPPDELLQSDLRMALGMRAYQVIGQTVARRLRPRIPRAELLKRA